MDRARLAVPTLGLEANGAKPEARRRGCCHGRQPANGLREAPAGGIMACAAAGAGDDAWVSREDDSIIRVRRGIG